MATDEHHKRLSEQVRFRGHVSRWAKARLAFSILAGSAIVAFNAGILVRGVFAGTIGNLHRPLREFTEFELEPAWFLLNVFIRLITTVIFCYGIQALWRQFRDSIKS